MIRENRECRTDLSETARSCHRIERYARSRVDLPVGIARCESYGFTVYGDMACENHLFDLSHNALLCFHKSVFFFALYAVAYKLAICRKVG